MTQKSKIIQLIVDSTFVVPGFYTDSTTTPQEISLALQLGASATTLLHKKALDHVRQETHAEAVKQVTEEYEYQLESTTTKLKIEKLRIEESLKAAQARIEALERSTAEMRTSVYKEAKEQASELLKAKDTQIQQLLFIASYRNGDFDIRFQL